MGNRYIWKYSPYKHYGGIDPFKPFDQGDGNWHNISQQAFLSAVGQAMRNQRSSTSYIAIPELRPEVRVEEDGDIIEKTVKTTVDWYAKPHWIVGGPIERGGPVAFTTAFKVPGCNPADDDRAHCIAHAGVSFVNFDGSNMPSAEYLAASFSQSEDGFTFFTMILATIAVTILTWGAGEALLGPVIAEGMAAGASIGAVEAGLIAGGGYAIASGGGNLSSAQPQYLGDVGDGQLQANPSGGWADPTQAVNNTWVQPELVGTQGGLNQYWQKQQPDVNEYSETNGVLLLREGTPQQSGIMDGIYSPPQP